MLTAPDIERDLAGVSLWRPAGEVARAASALLRIYRKIAPVGLRLVELPAVWSDAHREALLLFRHLAEELGNLRPQARGLLLAFGEEPAGEELPDFASPDLLAAMIERIDSLDPVAALPEADRSLLPLHLAEITGEAEALTRAGKYLTKVPERAALLPAFLWKLASSVEYHLVSSHIFDRSKEEPGVLSILDRLLERRG